MDPQVEARFQRIESILRAAAKREHRMEIRFDKQYAKAMERMNRQDDRSAEHKARADRNAEATRRLIRKDEPMANLTQLAKTHKGLARAYNAFLESFR